MAEDAPGAAYLAAMREQLDASARHFAEMHLRYCRGESCAFCWGQQWDEDRERLIDQVRD